MQLFNIPDPRHRFLARVLWAIAFVAVGQNAFAASVLQQNLVDLIEESNAIVVGTVSKVTDSPVWAVAATSDRRSHLPRHHARRLAQLEQAGACAGVHGHTGTLDRAADHRGLEPGQAAME